jgi:hypothetical protein
MERRKQSLVSDDEVRNDFDLARGRVEVARRRGDEDFSWHLRCAQDVYWTLKQRIGFDDLGDAKSIDIGAGLRHAQADRTVIRFVQRPNAVVEVLKCETQFVAGVSEHELLSVWAESGLPMPRSHVGGLEEICVDGLWTFVEFSFMDCIEGEPLSREQPLGNSRDHQLDVLGQLVELIAPVHRAGVRPSRSFSWAAIWFQYLAGASRYLQSDHPDLGWTLPAASYDVWREEIEVLSAGDVLLHGNCRGANVMRTSTGLVLHSPLAGIVSRPEWDLGMSCALEISDPHDLPVALELMVSAAAVSSSFSSRLDYGLLRYVAGCIAVFRASNSATTGVNEGERSLIRAKEWVNAATWAFEAPR